MRTHEPMRRIGPPVDLSRLVRPLGREVRRHLDTSPGYPTHHRVRPADLRRLRRALKNPSPAARAHAFDRLRRRILGGPTPPRPAP